MYSKLVILVCGCLVAAGISSTAHAVNVLMASQMADICLDENGQDAGKEICAAYVRGFIDSAVATDPRVIENVTMDLEESFSKKAARTRIGSRLKTAAEQGPAVRRTAGPLLWRERKTYLIINENQP